MTLHSMWFLVMFNVAVVDSRNPLSFHYLGVVERKYAEISFLQSGTDHTSRNPLVSWMSVFNVSLILVVSNSGFPYSRFHFRVAVISPERVPTGVFLPGFVRKVWPVCT